MACCLTAPSHYLNQSWLIISKVLGVHLRASSQEDLKIPVSKTRLKITFLKSNWADLPGAIELNCCPWSCVMPLLEKCKHLIVKCWEWNRRENGMLFFICIPLNSDYLIGTRVRNMGKGKTKSMVENVYTYYLHHLHNLPFVREIYWSRMDSPHKGPIKQVWWFLWCQPKQAVGQTFELLVNGEAMVLMCHYCNDI